jgi:hypothetical protein
VTRATAATRIDRGCRVWIAAIAEHPGVHSPGIGRQIARRGRNFIPKYKREEAAVSQPHHNPAINNLHRRCAGDMAMP